jgi:hypothetical protein
MMGGAGVIASFSTPAELDQVMVHIIPMMIGAGIPLAASPLWSLPTEIHPQVSGRIGPPTLMASAAMVDGLEQKLQGSTLDGSALRRAQEHTASGDWARCARQG